MHSEPGAKCHQGYCSATACIMQVHFHLCQFIPSYCQIIKISQRVGSLFDISFRPHLLARVKVQISALIITIQELITKHSTSHGDVCHFIWPNTAWYFSSLLTCGNTNRITQINLKTIGSALRAQSQHFHDWYWKLLCLDRSKKGWMLPNGPLSR